MNIALVLQHKLLLGIQRIMHIGKQASSRPLHSAASCVASSNMRAFAPSAPCPAAVRGFSTGTGIPRQSADKVVPLRVLRVVESGMPRSSTGRMVISGRMADVCAELDRLVEREAALH